MSERNCGIDLAKAVAIFLVVLFHVLTVGESIPQSSMGFYWGTYLTAFSSCCVNIFGLVSGYLGIAGHPSLRKWGRLWLQVFVINAVMTAVSHFGFGAPLGRLDYTHAVLPVTSAAYWYFTAYTGLYCLMPVLNAGLKALTRSQAFVVCGALFAVFSASASIGARDVYGLVTGHSVLWLVLLYVFGATIRLHLTHLPRVRWCLAAAAALPCLTLAQQAAAVRFPALAAKLEGRALAGHFISPVILGLSIALFLAMLQFRPAAAWAKRLVAFFSTTAFGIYLFHDQTVFHICVWGGKFTSLAEFGATHPLAWTAAVVGMAVGAFLVFSVVEKMRQMVMGRILG